jgi:hypothetical protein
VLGMSRQRVVRHLVDEALHQDSVRLPWPPVPDATTPPGNVRGALSLIFPGTP